MPEASPLTIVMYHYVRDFARSRYPAIKGLDVAGFRRQLDHLSADYEVVRMEDVIAAVRGEAPLPASAALLTFDDGYREHFDTVFPILYERGLQGSFFPPVAPVVHGELLDVNRIHFILATAPSAEPLGEAIDRSVTAAAGAFGLEPVAAYRERWAQPNRFDDAETIYVKRMLQTALPIQLRERIARELFETFVGIDEHAFASEVYMSRDQARLMVDCGMYFGSHGTNHVWLNHAAPDVRSSEINGSLDFLADIGMPTDDHWVMCYPYGGYDDELVAMLRSRGCTIGLTTEVATAEVGVHDPLTLPRYDTNDFPQ